MLFISATPDMRGPQCFEADCVGQAARLSIRIAFDNSSDNLLCPANPCDISIRKNGLA